MIGRFLGVALILAACASPQEPSASASSEPPSDSPAASETSAPTTPPTPAPTGEPPPQNVIAWILDLAPGSPEGPPEFRAYRNLMNVGDDGCVALAQGLEPDGGIELEGTARLLYGGVADACLAAFYGRSELWDSAAATFAGLPFPTSCMDLAAYRVLEDLLQAHQANPNGPFLALTDIGQAVAPPCPQITQLVPDHGPRGTRVRISGFNLDHVFDLLVFYEDEDHETFFRQAAYNIDGDALVMTMEDDTNIALWACVVAQGAEDWNGSGIRFTFEPDPGASPGATAAPGSPTALCPPPSTP